jgi:hypothetical protein
MRSNPPVEHTAIGPLTARTNKGKISMAAPLQALFRETFTLSRSMEYFNEAELVRQCGHEKADWPILLLKELLDNTLDACESASIPPKIVISVDERQLVISDNGPGLPADVVTRILDFNTRTSDKAAYVSPSRGTMGNGLKLVLCIPFVLNRNRQTTTIIEARGIRHTITIDTDQVRREPKIGHQKDEIVKTEGNRISITCDSPCSQDAYDSDRFLQFIEDYVLFNPHAALTVLYYGEEWVWAASGPMRKWTPSNPTSPHWYRVQELSNLILSHIAADETAGRKRSIREFVATFRGLSGTAKQRQVSAAAGLERGYLFDLLDDQQKLRQDAVRALLETMRSASAPVKPVGLGILGEDHFRATMSTPEEPSFRYKKIIGEASGLPYVVEAAFTQTEEPGRLRIGINSTVPLANPLQHNLFKQWFGLSALLTEHRIHFSADTCEDMDNQQDLDQQDGDRISLALHLCCPRFSFTDDGKGNIQLPRQFIGDVAAAILHVTKNWTRYKKAQERSQVAADRVLERQNRQSGAGHVSKIEAARQVMERSHLHARGEKPGPVKPRQVMYIARPLILNLTGKSSLGAQYFCQNLLPNFIKEFPELTKDWDIIWDDRGHLEEPHTGVRIGLGTAAVRSYLANRDDNTYGAILFIEKEGFDEILKASRLQERFDLAIMSSKGMSTTAARTIFEECARKHVKTLCFHDFDVSGFAILGTLGRNTRRYEFEDKPEVIDLGLRLTDVRKMDLPLENVELKYDPTKVLRKNGATPEEVALLRGEQIEKRIKGKIEIRFKGKRVELNAMTNPQLIAFLERGLKKHGVRKIIPDEDLLQEEYYQNVWEQRVESRMEEVEREVEREMEMESFTPPKGLGRKVAHQFKLDDAQSWKDAIGALVQEKKA